MQVWHTCSDGALAVFGADQPVWLTSNTTVPSRQRHANAVVAHPVSSGADFVAVVIVPDSLDREPTLNGVRLRAGAHGVRHTDQIELAGNSIWLATHTSIEAVAYDPATHGDDVYCFLSKRRVSAGEQIVSCPGVAGKACDVVYAERSWRMARQSTPLRCANCGFRPDEVQWRPELPVPTRRIDEILDDFSE